MATKREILWLSNYSILLAEGFLFRLGLGNIFRFKPLFSVWFGVLFDVLFCFVCFCMSQPSYILLRQNAPNILIGVYSNTLVHNMCFSLTSVTVNLYKDNCRKILDQRLSFFNLIIQYQMCTSLCKHAITMLLNEDHLILLKYRLPRTVLHSYFFFFSEVWEIRMVLLIKKRQKLSQVEYRQLWRHAAQESK